MILVIDKLINIFNKYIYEIIEEYKYTWIACDVPMYIES